ncbi:MAG TPA: sugar transferase, partial [Fimbriimonadaceae bacterium]|nr:sugar transferase [Fimbriimonadaceae bacterium]
MVSYDKANKPPLGPAVISPNPSGKTIEKPAPVKGGVLCAQYARPHYQVGKRLFDITVATLALLVLSPIFIGVYLVILLTGGFPVVYKQTRVGRNGKHFQILKFRTMVRNAEQILRDRPELMEEYLRTYKIANDPRISGLGHFLRSSTLDELPQLINVIKGEMSLVGPRPVVPPELEKFGDDQGIYLYMKPGCAGLWQCSGRSDLSYEERVRLDLVYCKRASLRYDFMIL